MALAEPLPLPLLLLPVAAGSCAAAALPLLLQLLNVLWVLVAAEVAAAFTALLALRTRLKP
jgi:hypothetical protein